MRKCFVILCIVAVAAFLIGPKLRSRVHFINGDAWSDGTAMLEEPLVRVKMPRVHVQKPTIHRTKRATNQDSGYTVNVKGFAPTVEEARKDAFDQASETIKTALSLQHATIDTARLEKMVTSCEPSDVDLGTSEGKELGSGKKVAVTFELISDYIRELMKKERSFRVQERMDWLARGLALMVAGLFAISGYVRLDEWSKGYVSGVLKFVAIFAVIATAAGIYFW